MSSRNDFPIKCVDCAKSSNSFIYDKCPFCRDVNFQEEVLCDLNRSTQNPASFECHAFQPLLKLVAASEREAQPEPEVQSVEVTVEKRLDSDKVKYQRTLAQQKLARDPDEVILEVKYHFVWNVVGRRPIFAEPTPAIVEFIIDNIRDCSEVVGGFSGLLWLAPDHIHLYVESDGEVSPDDLAQKLKRLSETSILEQFPDLLGSPDMETGLWDESYFVGTIG